MSDKDLIDEVPLERLPEGTVVEPPSEGRMAKEELDYPSKTLTRERKRELLGLIAESPEVSAGERIRAIEVDNRMTGDKKSILGYHRKR